MTVYKIVLEDLNRVPPTVLPVDILRSFEEELIARGSIARPNGSPLWFHAQQEILTYRWQRREDHATDHLLWIDIIQLSDKVLMDSQDSNDTDYLNNLIALLIRAAPHMSALSVVSLMLDEQESPRAANALPTVTA